MTYESYNPTVVETIIRMYKDPLAWLDTVVLIAGLWVIWMNLRHEGDVFITLGFGFAAIFMIVALYFMYSAAQSKIRVDRLDAEIDLKISEIEQLIKKQD